VGCDEEVEEWFVQVEYTFRFRLGGGGGLDIDASPNVPPPSGSVISSFPVPPVPIGSRFRFDFVEGATPPTAIAFWRWEAGDGGGRGGLPFGRVPAPIPVSFSHCSIESSEQAGRLGEGIGDGDRFEFRGRDILQSTAACYLASVLKLGV
jgi:hypothetical protein